jgi:hypothetical protein
MSSQIRLGGGMMRALVGLAGAVVAIVWSDITDGLNGASVPASAMLTPGNVLQADGAASTTWGPINLAGGANYVSGLLPIANIATPNFGAQAVSTTGVLTGGNVVATGTLTVAGVPTLSNLAGTGTRVPMVSAAGVVSALANGTDTYVLTMVGGTPAWAAPSAPASYAMGGDVTGTTAVSVVGKLNGATIPAAGALVTGNAPRVSGTSALTYSALDLAGGAGWVTGVLPAANQAAQTMGGGNVSGTTAAAVVESATGTGGVFTINGTTVLAFAGGATSGTIRMRNNTGARWLHTDGTTTVRGFFYDSSNVFTFGDPVVATVVDGLTWALKVAGTTTLSSTSALVSSAQPLTVAGAVTGTSWAFGAGPTITSGAGAPATTPADGSQYLRTNGTATTTLYVRAAGAWTAIGGGAASAGSAGEIQTGDGAGAFTAATNVLAGSGFLSVGPTPANIGAIRLANNTGIYFRNNANTNPLRALFVDNTDSVNLGLGLGAASTGTTSFVNLNATSKVAFNIGVNQLIAAEAAGLVIGGLSGSYGGGVGVLSMRNAGTATTGNPTTGIVLSSVGGVFTVRGSTASSMSFENPSTATTVGATGAAAALPALPTAYLVVKIGGTDFKVPYYAV